MFDKVSKECVAHPLLVSYSQNSRERALMYGLSKIVRFAEIVTSVAWPGENRGDASLTFQRSSFGIHRNPMRSRLDFRKYLPLSAFDFGSTSNARLVFYRPIGYA